MTKIISGAREADYEVLRGNAARAAQGFIAECGIGAGDTVSLFLRNDFAFYEASDAAAMLGAYLVPINWHYGAEEAGYIMQDSGSKVLVVHADLLPGIASAIPEGVKVLAVPTPPEIAEAYGITREQGQVPAGAQDWYEWLGGYEPTVPEPVESPGAMIYTSGTTGRPKGVRRTPASPGQIAELFSIAARAFGIEPGMSTIIPAPMYHSAPNAYAGLSTVIGAERIVLMPRFEPEELLRLIEVHRTTHIQTVPTMFVRLLKLPEEVRGKYDLSSLKFVVHAAAPCPPEVKRQMIEWWGPVINEYYGATEIGAVVVCNSEEALAHPGTVGRPVEEAELKILDDDDNELPVGEVGEIYCRLRGSTDFTYHGDDAKRQGVERQGLISVGDIGYLNQEGFLFICDRRNDMVISGGTNIYPAEIENCLIEHPAIADCAVFGIPDEQFGEALCACIQLRDGASLEQTEVSEYLRSHLAGYKVPKVIEFLGELPREDSGKIFKRKLREPYWEGQERSI
ncbi:MAG: AMP-binding protein [Gammaproteobacteria bacterium AqS3]|nr:AMP-binding protein [Gammaproteobacteria bacterium AqS3]